MTHEFIIKIKFIDSLGNVLFNILYMCPYLLSEELYEGPIFLIKT